jgi:nicotinamidase-related amidase
MPGSPERWDALAWLSNTNPEAPEINGLSERSIHPATHDEVAQFRLGRHVAVDRRVVHTQCPCDKRTWGAFTDTNLADHLTAFGVTQVVIAGISTSIGVESTARQAHELGFNVALAVDAMTDLNAEAHANSVTRIFPRLGETGTTEQVLEFLEERRAL